MVIKASKTKIVTKKIIGDNTDFKNDCLFCKIVKGSIPSYKILEDKDHIAILDIFPNTKGMTLVLTKKHFDSYAIDMPESAYANLMLAAKTVGKLLDKKLNVTRTAIVMEGMGVNHVHIKLYPMHGLDAHFKEMWTKDERYFETYPGYISTVLGPKADDVELAKISKILTK